MGKILAKPAKPPVDVKQLTEAALPVNDVLVGIAKKIEIKRPLAENVYLVSLGFSARELDELLTLVDGALGAV